MCTDSLRVARGRLLFHTDCIPKGTGRDYRAQFGGGIVARIRMADFFTAFLSAGRACVKNLNVASNKIHRAQHRLHSGRVQSGSTHARGCRLILVAATIAVESSRVKVLKVTLGWWWAGKQPTTHAALASTSPKHALQREIGNRHFTYCTFLLWP